MHTFRDQRWSRLWQSGLAHLIMIIVTLVMAVPVLWMFSTAVRPESTVRHYPIQWIPPDFTLENFQMALGNYPALSRWFFNSAVVAAATAILSVVVDSLAAYSLARLEFFGKKIVFIGILATMLIPVEATMVPLYLGLARAQVLATDFGVYMSLILPVVANAFGLYLLTQFFQGIPKDLEDSARIDGASDFGIWWRVILPLSGPAITAVIIFTFMASWNNFLWLFIVTSSDLTRTLPAGLAPIFGGITCNPSSVRYGVAMAGAPLPPSHAILSSFALIPDFQLATSLAGITRTQ